MNFKIDKGKLVRLFFRAKLDELPDEQLHALVLEKWEVIKKYHVDTDEPLSGIGVDTCAFCLLYWSTAWCSNECPIKSHTGRNHCTGTPFPGYLRNPKTTSRRMVEFLEKLPIPPEETDD